MEEHGVVPTVIESVPKEVMEVIYAGDVRVNLGNELTPTQVKDVPTVKWTYDPKFFYALCMTDPDAPSRENPQFREWLHWLVGNIPGLEVAKGDVLTEYVGAAPSKSSGLHRYVFVVYKQSGKIDFSEQHLTKTCGKDRANFSIKKFAAKYRLSEPYAGNFFQAQWDDYVPTLYAQLKN